MPPSVTQRHFPHGFLLSPLKDDNKSVDSSEPGPAAHSTQHRRFMYLSCVFHFMYFSCVALTASGAYGSPFLSLPFCHLTVHLSWCRDGHPSPACHFRSNCSQNPSLLSSHSGATGRGNRPQHSDLISTERCSSSDLPRSPHNGRSSRDSSSTGSDCGRVQNQVI